MDEETKQALIQKLHLDKPILAIQEDDQSLTLYLLGGEIIQVKNDPPAAQLPFDALSKAPRQPLVPGEARPAAPANPKRPPRKEAA
jgi:hypothetical protein